MSTSPSQSSSSRHKTHKSEGSHRTRSHASSVRSAVSSNRQEKLELAKQEASLKVKLAFAEQEKSLRIQELEESLKLEAMKIERDQKLEQLKIEQKLAETRAVMNVYAQIEREEHSIAESELANIPADEDQHVMRKFLNSQPASQKSVSHPYHMSENSRPPVPSRMQLNPEAKSFIADDDKTSLRGSSYTSVSSAEQCRHSGQSSSCKARDSSGWNLIASSFEKCVTQLTEANKQQNDVNKQLAVSSQLPKISVPVFNGDPLRYPLWKNSFNSLIDSQPLDSTTKLNYLNQYVTGKPKNIW